MPSNSRPRRVRRCKCCAFASIVFAALNKHYGALPFGVYDAWAPVTQMDGIHLALPQLASVARFDTVSDYEAYLKRLGAVPASIVQPHGADGSRDGRRLGAAKAAIRDVPRQLEVQLPDDPTQSPEYKPFKSFPADIAAAEQQRLAARRAKSSATRSSRPSGR